MKEKLFQRLVLRAAEPQMGTKMKERMQLWEAGTPFWDPSIQNEENVGTATITPYFIRDGKEHACIVICPGGGYVKRTWHEGEEIAEYVNAMGLHAFVVNYRVFPYKPEIGIIDAKRAVRFLRFHSGRLGILPDKIGIMGFSAGGGIACYTALDYLDEAYPYTDQIDQMSCRPDFCCLCYAALSLRKERLSEKDYLQFRQAFQSDAAYEAYLLANSCEFLVKKEMPPVFLWHAVDDERVPVNGSMDFAIALQEKNVPFECHLFPEGGHGLGITKANAAAVQWFPLFEGFLKRLGYL